MAKKLKQAKRNRMFAAWCAKESVRFVARKCNISITTVYRYKEWDNWDERLRKVRAEAQQKVDKKIIDHTAESLIIVRAAKARLAQNIKIGAIKTKSTISDLDKLVRLEQLLMGGADSRPDLVIAELRNMSTKALLKLLKQLEKKRK